MSNKRANPQYEFINKKYLQKVSRPSFAKFASEHEQEIIIRSAVIPFETSLELQSKWITYYNNVATVERPKSATAPRLTKTSAVFQRVYKQAKALKNTNAQVSAASITAIGNQAEASVRLLQSSNVASGGDLISSEEGRVDEEGTQTDTDAEQEHAVYTSELRSMAYLKLLYPSRKIRDVHTPNDDQPQNKGYISHYLEKIAHSVLKQDTIDNVSTELLKLSLSNILNFTNPQARNIYKSMIPEEEIINIDYSRQRMKKELGCDEEINSVIDYILDQLKLDTINTTNTDALNVMIDELKYKELNKRSSKYQVLNAVEVVVKNLRFWSSASPKSELTYLRKFEGLLEVIMDDTEIMLSDGESVCISTRDSLRSMLEENENTEYGRRIDLLVSCAHSDTTVELCSIEFKKEDASNSFIIHQQSKNARVNSCILSSINSLTKDSTNQVLAFDFAGNSGYMTQMYSYKDVFISQKVKNLHIPTHILELDHLRSTLKHLYQWKFHVVKLARTTIKSLYRNKRRYMFVETSEDDTSEYERHTPPPIAINNVFMTPHRSK